MRGTAPRVRGVENEREEIQLERLGHGREHAGKVRKPYVRLPSKELCWNAPTEF